MEVTIRIAIDIMVIDPWAVDRLFLRPEAVTGASVDAAGALELSLLFIIEIVVLFFGYEAIRMILFKITRRIE